MSTPLVLFQFGDDPFSHHYQDPQGLEAFTITEVHSLIAPPNPNRIIRLIREGPWTNQNASRIMGPDKSYFYFGAEDRQGTVLYGNNSGSISMGHLLKAGKKSGSVSRYFWTQSGKDWKWKIVSTHRMECYDLRSSLVAVWEVSQPDEEHFARLTLLPGSLSIVTEVLTTLTLNRMAQMLGW